MLGKGCLGAACALSTLGDQFVPQEYLNSNQNLCWPFLFFTSSDWCKPSPTGAASGGVAPSTWLRGLAAVTPNPHTSLTWWTGSVAPAYFLYPKSTEHRSWMERNLKGCPVSTPPQRASARQSGSEKWPESW